MRHDPFERDEELPPIDDAPAPEPRPPYLPHLLEPGEEPLPYVDQVKLASDQVVEAIHSLDRPAEAFVRWPFPDIDTLTGPMAPGDVWFVPAASGGGKTTFIGSCIKGWRRQGKKIYVMPLETKPKAFRTYLACMEAGIRPGDILSGEYLRYPDAKAVRDVVAAEFLAQLRAPYVDQVMVSGHHAITLQRLEEGLKEAKAFGAHVVVVDHIDHIEQGEGAYNDVKAINNGALKMAQDNGLLLVFTSQLNTSVSKGDYLAKYMPPRRDHVLFGALKENICTGMIGLFRPLRKRRDGESEDDYHAAIKRARSGLGEGSVNDMLMPNTMGVVAIKLRNYGEREGLKEYLWVEAGQCHPMREADRYTTGGGFPCQHL